MIPVLKSFLKCLGFAYVSLIAGWLCGWALVGLFVGLVPMMVGFLWIWDHAEYAAKDCWVCGRTNLLGRNMYTHEWYSSAAGDGNCSHCSRKLVQRGDRLYGTAIRAKAA